ncbi:YeiH family protein [Gemelliphila palaticanis]|uniref:Sulfate exporter family transporter n=1 Tax=Gemelliphila palaticanis TaxID=81950 RepID=A0ABX2T0U4_9BACL|nr:putative sulfate exporter family transporter [Gemella palaticanis]MBF0715876.1 putative sulfate exporter family transporter [Gemella palaticanis]NYS47806.1 putative sulfate exporter family transporter [Gemella palaticanis]
MNILKQRSFYLVFLVTLIISIISKFIAQIGFLKILGHLVVALIIGMVFQIVFKQYLPNMKSELGFISNKFLRLGIILLGSKLAIDKLISEGKKTLFLAFFIVAFMITLTYLICRFFKVERDLAILSSCGCGICGAAAVMGVSSQINSKADDSVLAVAVVAILGTLFTFIEVTIKPYIGLTDYQYGIFAGSSLHEIAHAVAAGGAGGSLALDTAILAKLSRVLMLVLVIIFLSFMPNKAKGQTKKAPLPYFIIGFILMSMLGSYTPFFKNISASISDLAYIFLGMAMFSLGTSVNFEVLKKRGGAVLTACLISSTILMIVCYFVAKYLF